MLECTPQRVTKDTVTDKQDL